MTRYMLIENSGVADAGSFSLLGASTSRGDGSTIGQFGSGAKHAILVLLRAGLQMVICCGTKRIVPFLEDIVVNGQDTQRVCLKIGTKTERTSMTIGFGELDWSDDVRMAMRELVSNALDQSGQEWKNIKMEVADSVRAKSGKTRVFVEMDSRVRDYYARINEYFLHWCGEQNDRILAKEKPSDLRFYRLGVFVRSRDENSLWDYNADEDVTIDESRNLDGYRIKSAAAKMLTNGEHQKELRQTLRYLSENPSDSILEASFDYWYLNSENVTDAFADEFGADALVTTNVLTAAKIEAKGFRVVCLPAGFYKCVTAIESSRQAETKLSTIEKREDFELVATTPECESTVQYVYDWLVACSMTQGRPIPTVKQYVSVMSGGSQTWGFWDRQDPDSIYIHQERSTDTKVILEELVHYATGFSDETRDFQDFVLRLACNLVEQGLADKVDSV